MCIRDSIYIYIYIYIYFDSLIMREESVTQILVRERI